MTHRISIVTGAAKGIGKACALALAAEGDRVFALDVDRDALADLPDSIEGIEADVGDLPTIERVMDNIATEAGRIDVLVNNAGVTRRADMMDLTEADWDRIMRVNAKGVFFCLQHAARHMIRQQSGRIINMASIAGRGYHASSNAIYAGSKGAVITMTRMAAHRLGPEGISVNAVCPGVTDTEIFRGIVANDAKAEGVPEEQVLQRVLSTIPARRGNTVEEIAALVVYLASPAARNLTGQAINLDGGLRMD
jgi:NAD(P)-dependent dehydrogenase (short-subunit alcohol dehydrogenase family)